MYRSQMTPRISYKEACSNGSSVMFITSFHARVMRRKGGRTDCPTTHARVVGFLWALSRIRRFQGRVPPQIQAMTGPENRVNRSEVRTARRYWSAPCIILRDRDVPSIIPAATAKQLANWRDLISHTQRGTPLANNNFGYLVKRSQSSLLANAANEPCAVFQQCQPCENSEAKLRKPDSPPHHTVM